MENLCTHILVSVFLILTIFCTESFTAVKSDGAHSQHRGILSVSRGNGPPSSRKPMNTKEQEKINRKSPLVKKTKSKEREKDKESLKDFIQKIDAGELIRQELRRRRIGIPPDSTLSLSCQVSRPNIFPNIFNQGDGFIVDAVIEWPIWLDLHLLAEALIEGDIKGKKPKPDKNETGGGDKDRMNFDDDEIEDGDEMGTGKALSGVTPGIVGYERCHIYEKIETGLSMTLDINKNQSRGCVLRAICEVHQIARYYPDAPLSIMFEMILLILTPSLGTEDVCYEDYLLAERAAFQAPSYCLEYGSLCPLNLAALFIRNFFPDVFSSYLSTH